MKKCFGVEVLVTGELFDENMELKQKFVKHNLITNAGYDFVANCFGNTTRPAAMRWIAVGKGTTAAAATQTALVSQVHRASCDFAHTNGSKFFTLGVTLGQGVATGALTEAGIFNAASGGVMFDRVVYPVINKDPLDTYRIVFQITMREYTVS